MGASGSNRQDKLWMATPKGLLRTLVLIAGTCKLPIMFDYQPDDMPAGSLRPVFGSDCRQKTIGARLGRPIIRVLHALTHQPRCGDGRKKRG